jgi:hypothetical protein
MSMGSDGGVTDLSQMTKLTASLKQTVRTDALDYANSFVGNILEEKMENTTYLPAAL